MPTTLRFYTLKSCSTCRKARTYLLEHGIDLDERPVRDMPPSPDELETWLPEEGFRACMNTSSPDYRKLGLSGAKLSREEVLEIMIQHPNLIKRPLVAGREGAVFGFKPEKYAALGWVSD